ncbi:MAG: tail fiber domain-containing protein [Lentimicrobium sp.]
MKKSLILFIILISPFIVFPQMAINTDGSAPNASAMLDIKSVTKGLLVPRMTSAQRTSIITPDEGLVVFDISTGSFWFSKLGVWVELADKSNSPWQSAGGNIYFNTGNVGIGDNTPVAALTVGNGDKFQVSGTDGDVVFSDDQASIQFPNSTSPNSPMIYMYSSVGSNADRMVLSQSSAAADYGLRYRDQAGFFDFLGGSYPVMSLGLFSGLVGIGTDSPSGMLHIKSFNSNVYSSLILDDISTTGSSRILFKNASGSTFWQVEGFTSAVSGNARLNFYNSTAGNLLSITGDEKIGIRTDNPTHDLHLFHQTGAGTTNSSLGLKIENEGSNNRSWTFYTVNSSGELWLYYGTNNVGRFATSGAYTTVSDSRQKSDIRPVSSLLQKVMELKPVSYQFNQIPDQTRRSIGFLAQEVEQVFPELVNLSKGDGTEEMYTLDYSGFGIIAVKAIQEQQKIIEDQQKQIDELKRMVEKLLD